MTGYTKLFSSITDSTVWREPDRTRLVWITMLAMADADGYVAASVPGLADRARVPLGDCLTALDAFRAPDEWSRTKEYEGRRVVDVDGGWQLLNHGKYRAIQDAEHRREQSRVAMQRLRAARKAEAEGAQPPAPPPAPIAPPAPPVAVVSTVAPVNTGERSLTQAEAEAEAATEAEAEAKAGEKQKKAPAPPWLTVAELIACGLTLETAEGFIAHRKAKKAKLTALAWKGFTSEVAKADGWTNEAAALKAIARNWISVEAIWLTGSSATAGGHVNKQKALEDSNRAVGESWAAKMEAKHATGADHEAE